MRGKMWRPLTTSPTTTCFPSHCGAGARVMKNWLVLLFLPEFAMLTTPARSCFSFSAAFSSLNLPP